MVSSLDEVRQIKEIQSSRGIGAAWEKCVQLGLKKVGKPQKPSELPNLRKKLQSYIRAYVSEPAELRNRIAHGQWDVALNRVQTRTNPDITSRIQRPDLVVIDRWWVVAEELVALIESMIESPNRTFHRDYWTALANMESFVARSERWTRKSKGDLLERKRPGRPVTMN